jgi:hypothetical protein
MTNAVIGRLSSGRLPLNDVSSTHETNLTIDIDLTAGFNPTSLEQILIEALPGYGQYQY